jgi:hypothetical protein
MVKEKMIAGELAAVKNSRGVLAQRSTLTRQ